MPIFSRRPGFYCAQITTGPASALLRLDLGPNPIESPPVQLLRSDSRFGDSDPDSIRSAVLAGVAEANATLGTALHPKRIEYASDNDTKGSLLRRAAFAILARLSQHGENGYDGHDG
jgi:hypothetical protein